MLPFLLSAAALPLAAQAVNLDANSFVQQSGLVRYPVRNHESKHSLGKRQDESGLTTQLTGTFYTIDLVLGTPGQTVSVNIDTGSDELWVNPVCDNSFDPEFCETFPQFTESSTLVDTGSDGTITYGTGDVKFDYVYDYVTVGDARINQQIFGVAYNSSFATNGILGLGPSNRDGFDSPYPYVVDSLAEQGFTNSRAFSLDIRALEDNAGSLIFGGIDTKKYTGPLAKRPIIPAAESPDGAYRFWIYLDGITVTQADGSKDVVLDLVDGQAVFLDSGATLSTLPTEIFNGILDAFPSAQPISGSTAYQVPCSVADTEGTVDITFGEVTINIPFADFIWHSEETCILGVKEADASKSYVLGDTFLRAAYVVYDWDNQNVLIANNEDCGSNLVAIGSGPDSVPSIIGECEASKPTTTTSAASSTTTSSRPHTTTTHGASTTSHHGNSTITTKPPHTTVHPTTSTKTQTQTYTITSCPPEVTDCPIGHVTTKVITTTTAVCPEVTGTYTLPHTCSKPGCQDETTHVVTIVPITTKDHPTTVPGGCTKCAPHSPEPTSESTSLPEPSGPPPALTTATKHSGGPGGPGTNATATATSPPVVPTAGASEWQIPSLAALAMGVLAAAAL